MRRFRGLLLHEYILLKPFVIASVTISAFCAAAIPAAALILKYAIKLSEYNEAMELVFLPFMFPAIFGALLTMCAGLRYENSVPKRNRFVFSLPVSRWEIVLSRVLIPSVVFYASMILASLSIEVYWCILSFDRPPETSLLGFIFFIMLSVMFNVLTILMFMSPKELLIFMFSFVGFMLLLSRIITLLDGVFGDVDEETVVRFFEERFLLLCAACVCLYVLTLLLSYLLAGRREKLCEG